MSITKNKKLIIILSLIACSLHAVILYSPLNYYVFSSAFKVMLFLLSPLIYFKLHKENGFKDMFSNTDKRGFKFSLILAFVVFSFILLLSVIISPFLDKEMIIGGLLNNGITASTFPFVFLYIVFINAALEEIFFRGFIFSNLCSLADKRYANIYSCSLFAVYHAAILGESVSPWIFLFFMFGLFIAGLIFNALTVECGSIIGSLVVHMAANAAINLVVYRYII